MNDHARTPLAREAQSLGDLLLAILIALALKQAEPTRSEWLAILEKDGWL